MVMLSNWILNGEVLFDFSEFWDRLRELDLTGVRTDVQEEIDLSNNLEGLLSLAIGNPENAII